jgi:bacteriocin-like protein
VKTIRTSNCVIGRKFATRAKDLGPAVETSTKRRTLMKNHRVTINLTRDQQKQLKEATGKSIAELNIDLDAKSNLTVKELEQISGGFKIDYHYKE